ncbi:MAG: stage 0 sporulation protein [Actinobacteria bacterium]|nr:MAG: stage 0 sporulation protein [Actinomycetota bacterium]
MPTVIGISFKEAGKIYYFDPDGVQLKQGDTVIVNTSQGTEYGEVVLPAENMPEEEAVTPIKTIVRKATKEDIAQHEENKKKEKEAHKTTEQKIEKHGLEMKLVDVEYVFDGSKIIFYFSADGRVDFRDLVKDLAGTFKTRIELKQIGVRDEAKMIGGLGSCGRHLCCTTFLKNFEPVSVKAAKAQNLPLNPFKISGACGRLMCCLRYEYDEYKRFNKLAPKKGSRVKTVHGEGVVVDYNVPRESVVVEIAEGFRYDVPVSEVEAVKAPKASEAKSDNGK